MMAAMGDKTLHMAMYPWFAIGHVTPFLHLSNKLAEKGHKISFFLPTKLQPRFEPFNHHPNLITFIPITVPHVDGLPAGTETTADVPFPLHPLIMTAMDLTEPVIEAYLRDLKPHFVFFDFTYWLPALSRKLGVKSVRYSIVSPITVGYLLSPERKPYEKGLFSEADDLREPPQNFPSSSIKLRAHEAREMAASTHRQYGRGISFRERQVVAYSECDAIGFKTCREMEGPYCDYIENQYGKSVILAGPVVPVSSSSTLDEQFAKILGNFEAETLVFCALGTEWILKKDQFQELVLGLELTGLPFLAVLKPPIGAETIKLALPEGFEARVKGRGFVYGGWVQQDLILKHPSVGCFVTHCGCGSLMEGMVNNCQLVFLPNIADQVFQARLMGGDLKVGVEVEKGEEDGLFTRDGICKAVKAVMDDDNELGKEVRKNHASWRQFLLSKDLENSYLDGFVKRLHAMLE